MTAVTPGREEISAIIAEWFPGKQSFRDRCADDILARLAAKPADDGWRPIETALRDRSILVVDQGVVSEAYYSGESDTWWLANTAEHDFDNTRPIYPTLWQPLPAPPSTTVAPKLDPPDNSLTDPSTKGEVE